MMASGTGRRVRGSVRFDPYYRVQRWDPISVCWRDLPGTYEDSARAVNVALVGGQTRIVEISMAGREVWSGFPAG